MGPFITLMVSLENHHQGGVHNGHLTNFGHRLIKQTLLNLKNIFFHLKLNLNIFKFDFWNQSMLFHYISPSICP